MPEIKIGHENKLFFIFYLMSELPQVTDKSDFDKCFNELITIDDKMIKRLTHFKEEYLVTLNTLKGFIINRHGNVRALMLKISPTLHSILSKLVLNDPLVILSENDEKIVKEFNIFSLNTKPAINLIELFEKMYIQSLITPYVDVELVEILTEMTNIDKFVIADLRRVYRRAKKENLTENAYTRSQLLVMINKLKNLAGSLSMQAIDEELRNTLKIYDVDDETLNKYDDKQLTKLLHKYLETLFQINNINIVEEIIDQEA